MPVDQTAQLEELQAENSSLAAETQQLRAECSELSAKILDLQKEKVWAFQTYMQLALCCHSQLPCAALDFNRPISQNEMLPLCRVLRWTLRKRRSSRGYERRTKSSPQSHLHLY